jgi:hypothetical protein
VPLHGCSAAADAGHSLATDGRALARRLREGDGDEATQPGTGSTADGGPRTSPRDSIALAFSTPPVGPPPDLCATPPRPAPTDPPHRGHGPGHCDHGTRGPVVRCFGCCAAPPPGRSIEHRLPITVLHQCSVAMDGGGIGRHPKARRLVADLRKRHELAQAEPGRYDRVRALNPRVRGSSPWRRTNNRSLTCAYSVSKIICLSRVDSSVLERCSVAGTGAP